MNSGPLSRSTVLGTLQKLVQTPSVNPCLAPDEGHGEEAIAKFAQKWLAEHGIKSWLEEAVPGRPNAVAEVGKGRGRTLVFCAHLDTVGTTGMTIPPLNQKLRAIASMGGAAMT